MPESNPENLIKDKNPKKESEIPNVINKEGERYATKRKEADNARAEELRNDKKIAEAKKQIEKEYTGSKERTFLRLQITGKETDEQVKKLKDLYTYPKALWEGTKATAKLGKWTIAGSLGILTDTAFSGIKAAGYWLWRTGKHFITGEKLPDFYDIYDFFRKKKDEK